MHAEAGRHPPAPPPPAHAERAALQRTAGGASAAPAAAQLPRPELGTSDEALLLANAAALELTLAAAADAVGAETPPAWIEELESLSAAEQHESEALLVAADDAAKSQDLGAGAGGAAGKLQLRRYQLVTRGGAGGLRMLPGDACVLLLLLLLRLRLTLLLLSC